ncbi:MAG: DNA adenine methylase [Deltaproteobacteria bacterium]|nr:DNA adenine methylase [Deltaproteobacteria bacterium]
MNSPLPYIGGKSKLSKAIIGLIPEHLSYCEVFAGAAWVFFGKETSRYEVINDLDSELVAFYRVLQHHLEEFLKQFKWLLCSREWFEDFKRQQAGGGLTDIQRAARYYYLQRLCFGGRVRGRTYAPSPEHTPRINLLRMEEELSQVHLRLARVAIEHLSWSQFLAAYDRARTFFYLDPPYYQAPFYKHNLELEDYRKMAKLLAGLKGKFILSINDHPQMRKTFKDFQIHPVSLSYTVSRGKTTKGRELIITNYQKKEQAPDAFAR